MPPEIDPDDVPADATEPEESNLDVRNDVVEDEPPEPTTATPAAAPDTDGG